LKILPSVFIVALKGLAIGAPGARDSRIHWRAKTIYKLLRKINSLSYGQLLGAVGRKDKITSSAVWLLNVDALFASELPLV